MEENYYWAKIRCLLEKSFRRDELDAFWHDYFLDSYTTIEPRGMSKIDMVTQLLECCRQASCVPKLLRLLEERNPERYRKYYPYSEQQELELRRSQEVERERHKTRLRPTRQQLPDFLRILLIVLVIGASIFFLVKLIINNGRSSIPSSADTPPTYGITSSPKPSSTSRATSSADTPPTYGITSSPKPSSTSRTAGSLIAFVSNRDGQYKVYCMNPDGSDRRPLTQPKPPAQRDDGDWWPSWSSNTRIFYERQKGDEQEIWWVDTQSAQEYQFTSHDCPPGSWKNGALSVSPNWNQFAFSSQKRGLEPWEIYVMRNAEGCQTERFGVRLHGTAGNCSWSPDGKYIVFMSNAGTACFQIYRASLENPDGWTNLSHSSRTNAKYPSWSPVADWIAFVAREPSSSQYDLRMVNAWTLEQKFLRTESYTGCKAKSLPRSEMTVSWSPDGMRIAYSCCSDGNRDICVYDLKTGKITNLTADWPSDELQPAWSR